ncbi:MAG: arylsulfatase [Opitutales bacterium]
MKRIIRKLILFLAFVFICTANAEKMNVLFIMTDDQGYGDISYYGNQYLKTPSIDKLASESLRLENYHAGTTCAPGRAGVVSAMYCNKVGVWHTIMGRSLLDRSRETIADVFKAGGYATGMFGKWHLGDNYPYRPFDRGFETTFWHKAGGIGQAPDYWGNTYFSPTIHDGNTPVKTEGFCTDVFFDAAIKFIEKSKEEGRPFFCYLCPNAPHSPFVAPKEYEDRFKDEKGKIKQGVPNTGFYGMIENIDDNMAKILKFLEEKGLDKNTVIVYTTDNGSNFGEPVATKYNKNGGGFNGGMRGRKSEVWEGGHRTFCFMKFPDGRNGEIHQLTGAIDVPPTLFDICGLKGTQKVDGISIKSVLENPDTNIDRYYFADNQRQELMMEDNPWVVMKGSMRLVNKTELYDVSTDVGQRKDIAKENPEVVSEMLKAYNEYWAYISPENEVDHPIYLASPDEESVLLNSHDRHVKSVHSQGGISAGAKISADSYWAVYAPEDGEYTIEILRWTPEFKDSLEDDKLDVIGGEIKIGDIHEKIIFDKGEKPNSVKFENVKLKQGQYKLFADYILPKGKSGSFYARITKK